MSNLNRFPELPSNIGKTVNIGFPDGSTMQWAVVDEIRKNEDEEKIFVLQKLRQKADAKQEMLRFGYYIVGKKPKMKDKWTWGQYCPFVSVEDFAAIVKAAQVRKWI